jgi:hypothetical protein
MTRAERTITLWSSLDALVGLWLVVSPFLLRYPDATIAYATITTGLFVAVIAVFEAVGLYREAWMSWLNFQLGVWLVIAPFAMRFARHSAPLWNHLITGAMIAVISWRAAVGNAGLFGDLRS